MSLQPPQKTVSPWNGTGSCSGVAAGCVPAPQWNAVSAGPQGTASPFSGLCWLTGKAVYEALGSSVPVGLISGAVGGTPSESALAYLGAVHRCSLC